MKIKNLFVIFTSFIILLCCISTINAVSDDVINNTVSEIDFNDEAISISDDEQIVDKDLSTSFDDNSKSKSGETTNPISLVYASWYSVTLDDEYTISSNQVGKIKYHRVPCTYADEGYHYNFFVFNKDLNILYKSKDVNGSLKEGNYTHSIPANSLVPGSYIIAAINHDDNKVLDSAILKVSGEAVITANNYNANYMSSSGMTVRITDKLTGKPLSALSLKVVFTKGKSSVTKYYIPNSNGQISFIPPVGVGTWTVTITLGESHITGSAVKTATIKKSKVNVKAYKTVEYKGFKTTLKASVKSNGKNVGEGTVTFKINGKSYKANVKNGVATKKIKLKNVKKYTYTAKFNGNANLAKSKSVKAKTLLKNRLNVKISFKNPVVYMGDTKKVVVKIKAGGKYVKGGNLKIKNKLGVETVKIKKGKIKLYATGLSSDLYKGTNGITTYYKKSVTKTFWMKYVPDSHKYKPVKVKYKATTKYKCLSCGKKGSHNHYSYGYFVRYTYPIKVV